MKTGYQVQTDIYRMLKGSTLDNALNGGIYHKGVRPRDSKLEDIVVIFTEGDGEQVQSGTIVIHVYVPDIYPFENGVPIVNIGRAVEVEKLLDEFISTQMRANASKYLFKLKSAVHTQHDEEIKQSFVVARLAFRILSE